MAIASAAWGQLGVVVAVHGEPDDAARTHVQHRVQVELRHLHRCYVAAVNHAVALDRDDLARELADMYLDEAQRMLADQAAGT